MQRGAMRSASRARAMRFQWQKLVTPLTPKSVVADWQRKDGEVQRLKNEASGTKMNVEPIDWDYWEENISAPGVVEQMKKEYEALNFPKVDPFNEANQATIDGISADIVQAKKNAVHGANEVKEADKVIAQVNKLKAEGLHYDLQQWYKVIPGLEDQHRDEYNDEDYLVDDNTTKLDTVDWKSAAKEYVESGDTDLGPVDQRLGDMVTAEEVELIQSGTWSISRLFASKDERAKIQERVEKSLASA